MRQRGKIYSYGTDKVTLNNLALLSSKQGKNQVLLHGSVDFFIVNGAKVTPKQLARTLLQDGIRKKMDVTLISCHTGKFSDGAAYQLSRYLKTKVSAPTDAVRTLSNGSFEIQNNGIWKVFH